MKKIILPIIISLLSLSAIAQKDTVHLRKLESEQKNLVTDRAPQAIYFQLGGSGPLFSVNYDRRFSKKLNGLGFAAGIGYFGADGLSVFSIPVSINYLIGHNTHFVEFAGGATYVSATTSDFFGNGNSSGSGILYHINVGYRYQPTLGGFFFRGGISPLFAMGAHVTSYYLGFGHNF